MDGLFVIIAIIIGIANLVQKQNQAQGRGNVKGRQDQYRQKPEKPVQMQKRVLRPLQKILTDLGEARSEMLKSIESSEGVEAEDRSRTGSLDYTEQGRGYGDSSCLPMKPELKVSEESKVVVEPVTAGEGYIFDLNEGNLINSIVMAEILGPPRAMKRRIR
ncbi:MAG TPA: hypothetical protein PLL98_06435 [Bacillota bacterium]|nr:hypothetical protein [Bacillota bacterium]